MEIVETNSGGSYNIPIIVEESSGGAITGSVAFTVYPMFDSLKRIVVQIYPYFITDGGIESLEIATVARGSNSSVPDAWNNFRIDTKSLTNFEAQTVQLSLSGNNWNPTRVIVRVKEIGNSTVQYVSREITNFFQDIFYFSGSMSGQTFNFSEGYGRRTVFYQRFNSQFPYTISPPLPYSNYSKAGRDLLYQTQFITAEETPYTAVNSWNTTTGISRKYLNRFSTGTTSNKRKILIKVTFETYDSDYDTYVNQVITLWNSLFTKIMFERNDNATMFESATSSVHNGTMAERGIHIFIGTNTQLGLSESGYIDGGRWNSWYYSNATIAYSKVRLSTNQVVNLPYVFGKRTLVMEEMTQALGLGNDVMDDVDTLFSDLSYASRNNYIGYRDKDRDALLLLYNEDWATLTPHFAVGNTIFSLTHISSDTTNSVNLYPEGTLPSGEYIIKHGDIQGTNIIYGFSEWTYYNIITRPSNAQWSTNIATGNVIFEVGNNIAYILSASEWNAFAQKINEFRSHKGLTPYTFTNVSRNTAFTRTIFNEFVDAMTPLALFFTGGKTIPALKSSGDKALLASDYISFRDALNSIT